jgi:hypothetical protein
MGDNSKNRPDNKAKISDRPGGSCLIIHFEGELNANGVSTFLSTLIAEAMMGHLMLPNESSLLVYDMEVIGSALYIIPRNLYTTLLLHGHYMSPLELLYKTEVEFEDYFLGFSNSSGAYMRMKSGVESIGVEFTITENGEERKKKEGE